MIVIGRTRDYHTGLFDEFEILNKIIKEKDEKIEELLEENEWLKNQNNKNSSNSSNSSLTNFTTLKKKTGANLNNYRAKSKKKMFK